MVMINLNNEDFENLSVGYGMTRIHGISFESFMNIIKQNDFSKDEVKKLTDYLMQDEINEMLDVMSEKDKEGVL